MVRRSSPFIRSIRAAPLLAATAAWSRLSAAPLTVVSTSMTTWFDIGSTDQAVPVTPASRRAIRRSRSAALRPTSLATPPEARTRSAAAGP